MGLFDKFMDLLNLGDDDYDDYDDFDEYDEVVEKPSRKEKAKQKESEKFEAQPVKQTAAKQPAKVTPMRPRKSGGFNSMELRVIKPTSFDDATEITDTLLNDLPVVLNLEGIDMDLAHRIMDYTYGSCYALKSNLRKVSNYILVITPERMDISGDYQELFVGAATAASFDDDF